MTDGIMYAPSSMLTNGKLLEDLENLDDSHIYYRELDEAEVPDEIKGYLTAKIEFFKYDDEPVDFKYVLKVRLVENMNIGTAWIECYDGCDITYIEIEFCDDSTSKVA